MINKRILYKVIPQISKNKINIHKKSSKRSKINNLCFQTITQSPLNSCLKSKTNIQNQKQLLQLPETKRHGTYLKQYQNDSINTVRKNQNFKQNIHQISTINCQKSQEFNIPQSIQICNQLNSDQLKDNKESQNLHADQYENNEQLNNQFDDAITFQEYQNIIEINWNSQKKQYLKQQQNSTAQQFTKKIEQEKANFNKIQQKQQEKTMKQQNELNHKKDLIYVQNQDRIQRFMNHLNSKIIQRQIYKNQTIKGKIKRQKSLETVKGQNKQQAIKDKIKRQIGQQTIKGKIKKQNNFVYHINKYDNQRKRSISSSKNLKYDYLSIDYLAQQQNIKYPYYDPEYASLQRLKKNKQNNCYKTNKFQSPRSFYYCNKNNIITKLNESNSIQQQIIKTPNIYKLKESLQFQTKFTNQKSQKIYYSNQRLNDKMAQDQLDKIFSILDCNKSGIITKYNYGIQNVNQQLRNILISITNRIKYFNQSYNRQQFIVQVWSLVKTVYFSFVKSIFQQQIEKHQKIQLQKDLKNRSIRYSQDFSTLLASKTNYFNTNVNHQNKRIDNHNKTIQNLYKKAQNSNNQSFQQLYQSLFAIKKQQIFQNKWQKERELRKIQKLDYKVNERINFFKDKIKQFSTLNCF